MPPSVRVHPAVIAAASRPFTDARRAAISALTRQGPWSCHQGTFPESGAGGSTGWAGYTCAAAGAAATAALLLSSRPSQCYYKEREDGSIDRLTRWSALAWNVPSGVSPVFHVKAVNVLLQKHLPRAMQGLGEAPSALVPLCGKSFDLPYLCENGFGVVGVEGVSRAVHEFRSEQKIRVKGMRSRAVLSRGPNGQWLEGERLLEAAQTFRGSRAGAVFKLGPQGLGYYVDTPAVWRGKVRAAEAARPLHLIEGDMFDVDPSLISSSTFEKTGQFDLIYDRSALDVVPPQGRVQYVETLSRLLRPGGRILLVVLDYDQAQVPVDPTGRRRTPPPYSIPQEMVGELFPTASWDVELLSRKTESELSKVITPFREIHVWEGVYLITKRPPKEHRKGYIAAGVAAVGLAGLGLCAAFLGPREFTDSVSALVHTFGAVLMFATYIAFEFHALWWSPVIKLDGMERWLRKWLALIALVASLGFQLLGVFSAMAETSCTGGHCSCTSFSLYSDLCVDKWQVPTPENIEFSANQSYWGAWVRSQEAVERHEELLYNTATGWFGTLKVATYWLEVIAGLALLNSHLVIWYFCPERNVELGEELPDIQNQYRNMDLRLSEVSH